MRKSILSIIAISCTVLLFAQTSRPAATSSPIKIKESATTAPVKAQRPGATAANAVVGVEFFNGTWDELLAKAKAEDKPILLDGYASWCKPCKHMLNEVMPKKAVGNFYNANFINYKLDMEKGEGPKVAKLFDIKNYPTFMFLDSNGEFKHKILGAMPAADFIAAGKKALSEKDNLAYQMNAYKNGNKDVGLLRDLGSNMKSAFMPGTDEVLGAFMAAASPTDLAKPKNAAFLFKAADKMNSPAFKAVMQNKDVIMKLVGKDKWGSKIGAIAMGAAAVAGKSGDKTMLKSALSLAKGAGLGNTVLQQLNMNFLEGQGNWKKYAKTAVKMVAGGGVKDAGGLNNLAWSFFENVDSPKQLAAATGWAKKSFDMEPGYANADTYAALLFKTGKKAAALEMAQKAIGLAKQEGSDAGETKSLLEKIKAMK